MNKPTTLQITNKAKEIFSLIENNKSIEILCNDGSVFIDCNTLDFTYTGSFGNKVLMSAIKNLTPTNKILSLAAHIEYYSHNIGGFNITTN